MSVHKGLWHSITRCVRRALRIPLWLNRKAITVKNEFIHQFVMLITERHWLVDYIPQKSTPTPRLVLVRFDLIGDFIIWLDAAKEFRCLYPDYQITLYANAIWADLAERLPYWDHVVAIDVPRLRDDDFYRLKVLISARRESAHAAVYTTYSREYIGDLLVRATGAQERIAHQGDSDNISAELKQRSDVWYTRLIPSVPNAVYEFNVNA
jgi:hypothetical protein